MHSSSEVDDLLNEIEHGYGEPCYPLRINKLKTQGRNVGPIESGIADTVEVLEGGTRSFVIYGEPQSGKTEFMIALVCKLIDIGYQTIFVVMNDNTELEVQNFDRFHSAAELNPTPVRDFQLQNMSHDDLKVSRPRVIFCRKNSKNLQKLIPLTRFMDRRVVIDDEADYATPNSKINKSEMTAINEHLGKLGDLSLSGEGVYIGVTATPARLDLNNTYLNDSSKWVFLESHSEYKGRSFFFPVTVEDKCRSDYQLVKLPDDTDDPKLLRHAVYRFLCRVAILNIGNKDESIAYSMLIHTAGKTNDHEKDQKDIEKIIRGLSDRTQSSFRKVLDELLVICNEISVVHHCDYSGKELARFIIDNIGRSEILVINHKNDSGNVNRAGKPKSLFTFAIGGNIVSRGLTFENLLTFYFSRNVKGKLQQNTYIQRARMFGYRPYSKYFELCVPEQLMEDWGTCFQNHELSLRMAKAGSYVHVQGKNNSVVDRSSIDFENVTVENSERPVGSIFTLTPEIESGLLSLENGKIITNLKVMINKGLLPSDAINPSLIDYLEDTSKPDESDVYVVLKMDGSSRRMQNISAYSDGYSETLTRKRGGIIHAMLNKRPEYISNKHFILPIVNDSGQCRILYKGKFGHAILQNMKVSKPINN